MSALPIIEYPDKRLQSESAPVERFDHELNRLVDNLRDTLYATTGIGLCAPQLGDLRRVLVMDLSESQSDCQEYINPVIRSKSGIAIANESCLSLPGISAKVVRAAQVRVWAQDRHGESFERELDGMYAICLQHELDHLDGKLFIDRLSALRRLPFRSRLDAMRRRASDQPEVSELAG